MNIETLDFFVQNSKEEPERVKDNYDLISLIYLGAITISFCLTAYKYYKIRKIIFTIEKKKEN
jgi:hypothetical protein